MIKTEFSNESIGKIFNLAKKTVQPEQLPVFEDLCAIIRTLSEQFSNLSAELKKKSDKELLFQSIVPKANSKDVADGFLKIKQHFERILNDKKMDFIPRSEISTIIKDTLLLKENEQFSFGGYYEKMNNINLEKMLEKKFQDMVKKEDFLNLIEQKDLSYVKKEEIYPIRELMQEFQNKMDNFEIDNKLRLSNYEEEVQQIKNENFREMEKTRLFFNENEFVKKKDLDFFDKNTFSDLQQNLKKLNSLKLEDFCKSTDLFLKRLQKKSEEIQKKNKEDYMTLENKNENNKNELQLEFLKNKNEIIKTFEKLENKKNKKGAFNDMEKTLSELKNKFEITAKNLDIYNSNFLEQTSTIKEMGKELNKVFDINEKLLSLEKTLKSLQNDKLNFENREKIQNVETTNPVRKNENKEKTEIKEIINNLKLEFFSQIKNLKKEILYQEENKIQNKLKQQKSDPLAIPKNYENFQLEKISFIEKEIEKLNLQIINILHNQRNIKTNAPNILIKNKDSLNFSNIEENDLRDTLLQKSDFSKICEFLDEKANIKDINELIKDIYQEIDKISKPEITQNPVNLNLTKTAQYIWKSGKTIANRIPWEVECYNNQTDIFILAKNKFELVIMLEGLYEISFGIFGRKKPKFTLFLNGEAIVSSTNIKLNDNSDKFENKHTNGNVVGLTLFDFFVFPFNSHIWFEFTGSFGYEGFLKITKL